MVTLGNGSGTHFQASQCISMDLAADARFVHTLSVVKSHFGLDAPLHSLKPSGSAMLTCVKLSVGVSVNLW